MTVTAPRRAPRAALASLPAAAVLFAAAAAAAPLTVHDVVLRLREVREVAVAPDGGSVAYALRVSRDPLEDEDGKPWDELHVVDADGVARPFVTEARVSALAWRPGRAEVSFLAEREGDEAKALWAIPADGGEARRLLGFDGEVSAYAWSADGARVAVAVADVETEEREEWAEKGFDQEVYEEDWLPERLFVATLAGDDAGAPREVDAGGIPLDVAWSPVDDRLAVRVAPTPLVDDDYVASRVVVVDAASGERVVELDTPGKLGELAWSPDGRHLAVLSAADPADPREGRLMVAPRDGPLRDLLPGLEAHVVDFAWEDAEHLLAVVHEGTGAWLGRVDLQGRRTTVLPAGGPIWEEVSVAPTGEAALRGSTPRHPDEVFLVAAGEPLARRLTDSNPWLAAAALAPQETVRWTARDGLEIEGVLMRPLGLAPGARAPLVVIVHGGPESHVSDGWVTSYSRPSQVFAAMGYAVLQPNYRSSTGRGVAFSKLDHGDPGGKEFDDVVDGVDHLVATGLVDRDRVGITGGSYGGYATAWGATYYTERYAAAVMSVGISDRIAKFGTSDIPHELHQVHGGAWPWEDWQLELERSPIYHVEKARTPILILHGAEDTRPPRAVADPLPVPQDPRPGPGAPRPLPGRKARQPARGVAPRLRPAPRALDGALPPRPRRRPAPDGARLRAGFSRGGWTRVAAGERGPARSWRRSSGEKSGRGCPRSQRR